MRLKNSHNPQTALAGVCSGCGICVAICPTSILKLTFTRQGYLRPSLKGVKCADCNICEKACPFTSNFVVERYDIETKPYLRRSLLVGDHLKVGLAWSSDDKTRFKAASGGAITSLLRYLLDQDLVEAVLVPKIRMKNGKVYGRYDIVRRSKELICYAGSIYAPTDISWALRTILKDNLRVAIVGLPCQIKGLRNSKLLPRLQSKIKALLGLYCNNVPSWNASKYAIKTLVGFNPIKVTDIRFRGNGWPGYVRIKTLDGEIITVPYSIFYDCGFGQYFYDESCFLCSDHTAELADISFADPWTYQQDIKTGKTLVVIRTPNGSELIAEANKAGYVRFEELSSSLYAIQYTTLLKKTIRGITFKKRAYSSFNYVIPIGLSSVIHELDYRIGHFLAHSERFWPLLKIYSKLIKRFYKPLYAADYILKTKYAQILSRIERSWIA